MEPDNVDSDIMEDPLEGSSLCHLFEFECEYLDVEYLEHEVVDAAAAEANSVKEEALNLSLLHVSLNDDDNNHNESSSSDCILIGVENSQQGEWERNVTVN